ncbi:hypothetical protein [Congregibacter litoralis]|uniref:Phospholipase n=1 Tax=Congregibacter litoralis KT71 TaxID=314285 RepID=A4A501_9GAMM|nr:hypothetical protein [Congregibacter litoralis]EAQ98872.1 hypothetical protein KT71_09602 [Congregibacter litoralis KT71]
MRLWFIPLIYSLLSSPVWAWSDHASLLWPLVRTQPELLSPSLEVESLDAFLQAEASGLAELLNSHEAMSRATLSHYASRPEGLAFSADADDLRDAFLRAIRVNPELAYPLYRQSTVEDPAVPPLKAQRFDDLSFLDGGVSHDSIVYIALESGEHVAPAHVLASGSDEPDFGMDIGLFADNDTEFGAGYGFGDQPFGNPNLEYSSQAPFHMGFYHLDWVTRKAQPDLLRTYPEWRVSLFRALSRFAFETGHDYWGWRFAGWGLHYIGDLTQPYHAHPLPGVGTMKGIWTVLRGKTVDAIQLVSNRHGVLESYQYQRVQKALEEKSWDNIILAAVARGEPVPEFNERTVRDELTKESVDAGKDLDLALVVDMPPRYVSDPAFEWNGSGEEAAIVVTVASDRGEIAIETLDAVIAEQMLRFSRFAQAWINDAKQAWSADS